MGLVGASVGVVGASSVAVTVAGRIDGEAPAAAAVVMGVTEGKPDWGGPLSSPPPASMTVAITAITSSAMARPAPRASVAGLTTICFVIPPSVRTTLHLAPVLGMTTPGRLTRASNRASARFGVRSVLEGSKVHRSLAILLAAGALVARCGGGDDTSALQTQVAALQTQIAQPAAVATPTLSWPGPTARPIATAQPPSATVAPAAVPRLTEAAVVGALRQHRKEAWVCESLFGSPVSRCTVDLYIRAFCNFDNSAPNPSFEFVIGGNSHQPRYKATWDKVRSRWDVEAGCETGPHTSSVYSAWYFEDRDEFVGADNAGVSMLN